MSRRVIVRGWFSSRYSWRPTCARTGSVVFVHLSALYDVPAMVIESFFVCALPVNFGPIGVSCVQRAVVELQFLRGCDGGIRRLLGRGAGMDHLPLLARRALPVASNRIINCIICSNGAMVGCVLCMFSEAIDRLGKSSIGPAKQVPGVCGSTVGPLLHIGSSLDKHILFVCCCMYV